MKKYLRWLFREDLDLKNKWWHRLLSIAFIFSFVICVVFNVIIYSSSDMFRGGQVQQWKKVGTLSERITTEAKPISAFVGIGEKIGENDRTYVLNDQPSDYYKGVLNDVYCSTELYDNVEKIKSDRNIDTLYIRSIYNRSDVPLEVFSDYIKQNDIKCLIVDAYSYFNGSRVTFLEPDKSYQNNWSFYEQSSLKTLIYFIEMLGVVLGISLVLFFLIMVAYYKIFLYIVYGSKK